MHDDIPITPERDHTRVSIEYLPQQGEENPHRHHQLTPTNITANHSGSIFSARSWCSCKSLGFVAEQQGMVCGGGAPVGQKISGESAVLVTWRAGPSRHPFQPGGWVCASWFVSCQLSPIQTGQYNVYDNDNTLTHPGIQTISRRWVCPPSW